MPVLGERGRNLPGSGAQGAAPPGRRFAAGLAPACSNAACASGWLRLWRSRQAPVFEGGWVCGAGCAKAVLRGAVTRELQGRNEPASRHHHRLPLGLLLLGQGVITRSQLRAALARQKLSGGRLGLWLEREHGVEERAITRALGAQWGCPVLTLENHSPEKMAGLVPRLFLEAFGFLPIRQAGSVLLYVGFEDRVDRCITLAIERMTGLRVEAGVVDGREYSAAHRLLLEAQFPPARMVEAAGVDALVGIFTRMLEEAKPVEARMVRMHDYFWLRMWKRGDAAETGVAAPGNFSGDARGGCFEDVLGSLAGSAD